MKLLSIDWVILAATTFTCSLDSTLGGAAANEALAHASKVKAAKVTPGEADIGLALGGVGGVYFLAEPGELVVEVEKRDRNRRDTITELRAILFGPDRRVLQEATIPDDGRPKGTGLGPPGRVRLSSLVEHPGVYGLNITASRDRYGQEIIWGFRANCSRYLIETSRGHKDESHQEPIVLLNPSRPGNVCFRPRAGSLRIEVTGLPPGVGRLTVYDAKDVPLTTMSASKNGTASHTFAAEISREAAPWRLHLPKAQATIHIDGVTRWDRGSRFANFSYWSPEVRSWFSFMENRWLLTPYSQQTYGRPGRNGEVRFRVHNNAAQQQTVLLEVEFPKGPWPARLSSDRVLVGSGKSVEIALTYKVPNAEQCCHIRATATGYPGYSTYSTLTVKPGVAPAATPLDMPILLKPYGHENEQFGYLPDYPVENQAYFDPENRPFVRTGNGIATLRNGRWSTSDLSRTLWPNNPGIKTTSFGMPSTKIAFDRGGDVYFIATARSQAALLHSADGGRSFAAYPITASKGQGRAFDIEQFSGHNQPEHPPPFLRYTRTASDPKLIWRRINDLELFLPEKVDGRIRLGKPVLLSKKCIGLSAHSGIPASVVSRGSKVHVAWGEATEPTEKVPGVPGYVATYDRQTRELGPATLVGYGAPPNDVHNSPSLTMDSQGYLHALVGTHGRPFHYARSLKPNLAHGGWIDPIPVGAGLRQTYIGLVCGPDDTLHLAFRLWRYGTPPHPRSSHATLAYQRKRPDQPWENPRILVVAPFSEYSIFYHRLTLDPRGRLFLSYDYWSTYWFYRTDHFGRRRALLTSPDGGDTWKLAETGDLR